MASNKFLEFIELEYDTLTEKINNWLSQEFNKRNIQYNNASVYGQIVNLIKSMFLSTILYIKQTLKDLNIEKTTDKRAIRKAARLTGHNPTRSIAASGVLKFKVKGGVNIFDELESSNPAIIINNKTKIKNNTNSLTYSINLGNSDNVQYNLNNLSEFYVNVLQGVWEMDQTYTGDGTNGQSFTVEISNNMNIDNFNVNVKVNGEKIKIVDSEYDMLPNEKSCMVKTGIEGGIDIYFGDEDRGYVPKEGTIITVEYLVNNGSSGEILNPVLNDWKFEDDVKDLDGQTINMDDIFDISVFYNIGFASDGESVEQTKKLIIG
jgi:hypothetical protein